jgi:pyrroloquinoline quinone (PQQ) biosynthesis protein C
MSAANVRKISSHPTWVASLYEFVTPHWDALLNSPWAEAVASTQMSVEQMQGWILQIYPFIHDFPKFLAEGLIKVEDEFSRNFLIENIRLEKAHAEHWIWMGEGFGLNRKQMLEMAEGEKTILRDVQSLTDWVWRVNTKGSLAEAVAATSFAIEGVAGALTRKIAPGFEAYRNKPGVDMNPKTYKWIREHAHYDDEHPKFALEIIKHYAITDRMQRQVMFAAKRSLELLHLALHASSKISPQVLNS